MSGAEGIAALLRPERLWSRGECLVRECPVPRTAGIYAWFFRVVPPGVPAEDCHQALGATLLYTGISPRQPAALSGRPSRQTLRSRIRNHYRGNAAGSTLRLTLGCLLAREVGVSLRRVGRGDRCTFGEGEAQLSEWMARNALVAWLPTAEPWRLEQSLIRSVSLPLNLQQNQRHPFHARLSVLRREARVRALG